MRKWAAAIVQDNGVLLYRIGFFFSLQTSAHGAVPDLGSKCAVLTRSQYPKIVWVPPCRLFCRLNGSALYAKLRTFQSDSSIRNHPSKPKPKPNEPHAGISSAGITWGTGSCSLGRSPGRALGPRKAIPEEISHRFLRNPADHPTSSGPVTIHVVSPTLPRCTRPNR